MKKLLLSVLLCFICGCASSTTPSGNIVDKYYIPVDSSSMFIPQFDFNGNLSGFTEIDTSHPEYFGLKLENGSKVYVNKKIWERKEVGQMFGLEQE